MAYSAQFLLLLQIITLASMVFSCPNDQFCKVCIQDQENEFQCLSCQNAYFNQRSKECFEVDQTIPNCITYQDNSSHKCLECDIGFYPQADGTCKECPVRCRMCSADECLGCAERLIPVSGNCTLSTKKCSDQYCSICNKDDRCMLCDNGYSINGTGSCVRSIDYCAEVGEQTRCQKCWESFYLDSNLQCVQIQHHVTAWYIFVALMLALLLTVGWFFLKKEHRHRTFTEDSYANFN